MTVIACVWWTAVAIHSAGWLLIWGCSKQCIFISVHLHLSLTWSPCVSGNYKHTILTLTSWCDCVCVCVPSQPGLGPGAVTSVWPWPYLCRHVTALQAASAVTSTEGVCGACQEICHGTEHQVCAGQTDHCTSATGKFKVISVVWSMI